MIENVLKINKATIKHPFFYFPSLFINCMYSRDKLDKTKLKGIFNVFPHTHFGFPFVPIKKSHVRPSFRLVINSASLPPSFFLQFPIRSSELELSWAFRGCIWGGRGFWAFRNTLFRIPPFKDVFGRRPVDGSGFDTYAEKNGFDNARGETYFVPFRFFFAGELTSVLAHLEEGKRRKRRRSWRHIYGDSHPQFGAHTAHTRKKNRRGFELRNIFFRGTTRCVLRGGGKEGGRKGWVCLFRSSKEQLLLRDPAEEKTKRRRDGREIFKIFGWLASKISSPLPPFY